MKEKIRDMEGEINSLRLEVKRMNGKMQDLLEVLSNMRSEYSTRLGISENEFLDLERVR